LSFFDFPFYRRAKVAFLIAVVKSKNRNNFGQGVGRCQSRRIIVFIY
jgi:hypothetical protein